MYIYSQYGCGRSCEYGRSATYTVDGCVDQVRIGARNIVRSTVFRQMITANESFATHIAREFLLSCNRFTFVHTFTFRQSKGNPCQTCMRSSMTLKLVGSRESFLTTQPITSERLVSRVSSEIQIQIQNSNSHFEQRRGSVPQMSAEMGCFSIGLPASRNVTQMIAFLFLRRSTINSRLIR